MPSPCKWKASGKLKESRKPLNLSFWRFAILLNWSHDLTWAKIDAKGNLTHTLFGLTRTDRMVEDEKVLSAWSFIFFKFLLTFGFARKN